MHPRGSCGSQDVRVPYDTRANLFSMLFTLAGKLCCCMHANISRFTRISRGNSSTRICSRQTNIGHTHFFQACSFSKCTHIGFRCWVFDAKTALWGDLLVPLDHIPPAARFGAYLPSIPPQNRVGDYVRFTCCVVNVFPKRLNAEFPQAGCLV